MSSKLLDVLFSNPCTHQFSWPRRSPKGNYYQVCLICGDEYQYDWSTMSRKARIKRASNLEGSHATRREAGSLAKTKWVRRARRFRTDLPMQFREKHTELWQKARSETLASREFSSEPQLGLVKGARLKWCSICRPKSPGRPTVWSCAKASFPAKYSAGA